MRTLEEALIHSAELELKMLASLMHDGEPDQQANCYQRISALIMLAYIPDSGLTSGGVAALERIEAEANKLIPATAVDQSKSKTICDYPLEVGEVVIMPAGAEVLSVYSQGKQIFLCALGDPNKIKDHRSFVTYQHGSVVRDDDCLSFIGSVLLEGEKQASHVFEYIVPY